MPVADRNTWDLVTHFQTGPFAMTVLVLCAGSLALYLAGARKYGAGGSPWPFWRTEAFVAGLAGVVVGACSGLATYSASDVTFHVACHVVLMMTVPALLSLGRPMILSQEAGGPRVRRLLDVVARSGVARAMSHPVVAWTTYLGSMYLMLTDRAFFNEMMVHPWLMDVNQAAMVAFGLLYWGPLVSSPGGRRDTPYAVRVVSILANMPFEVLAGIWLRYQTEPLMNGTPVSGTQLAGEVFIVGATLVSTVWLVAVIVQWGAEMRREEESAGVPVGDADGWTVPWWVAPVPSLEDGRMPGEPPL
jgi:cytochrome c oxidase assembly factor CtaG